MNRNKKFRDTTKFHIQKALQKKAWEFEKLLYKIPAQNIAENGIPLEYL